MKWLPQPPPSSSFSPHHMYLLTLFSPTAQKALVNTAESEAESAEGREGGEQNETEESDEFREKTSGSAKPRVSLNVSLNAPERRSDHVTAVS